MLTVTSPQTVVQELGFKGKSTDTKPTHYWNGQAIPNASTFYEIDTGNIYMYDADTKAWIAQ